jgi:serine protease DegS
MSKTLNTIVWPTLTGILAAVLIVQFFPQLTGSKQTEIQVLPAAADQAGAQLITSYADAVEKAAPSVVSIYGRTETDPQKDALVIPQSLGSGVILTKDGFVVTNNHVVSGSNEILVSMRDGRELLAKVVGTDPESDLALLKIDATELPAITLIPSKALSIGDVVLAIGNPFGVGQTVTQGIISGMDRHSLGLNTYEDFLQTDAAINPGNSGGALVTAMGDLAGINTAIFSKSGGSQGIGFAIPSDQVLQVMSDLVRYGRVIRGWVGVEARIILPAEAEAAGLDKATRGLLFSGIYKDSPAQTAGLLPGDVLLAIDSEPIIGSGIDAMNKIARVKPGDVTNFTIFRDKAEKEIQITTTERPRSR